MHRIRVLLSVYCFLLPSVFADGPASKVICDKVLPRLISGASQPRLVPLTSFKISGLEIEGVNREQPWLHRYADNLWGISGENDSLDRVAQSLLLGNNPTPHRSDILYIFAHGLSGVPVFIKDGTIVTPDDLLAKLKQLGHDPISRMKAIVLLSCHSGSPKGNGTSEYLPTSAYLSGATGLPVIAPTGALAIGLRNDGQGWRIEDFHQQNVAPGTTGWSLITATKEGVPLRTDILSTEEMREISGFYKKWEAATSRELPDHLKEKSEK